MSVLSLNGYGDGPGRFPEPHRFPWGQFTGGFAPLVVRQDGSADRWLIDHPTHPIGLHTTVVSDAIGWAGFPGEDITRLGEEPSWLSHPVWAGIFKAFVSWPAILSMESPSYQRALFVSRPELLNRLPGWMDVYKLRFVVPDRAEFDRLIGEALALHRLLWATRARDGWADEAEQDTEAFEAFADFIDGKKEKEPTYTFGGQPVTPDYNMSGSFLNLYAEYIDWRQGDDEIVESFARRLKKPQLELGPSNDTLEIVFRGASRHLTYDEIGKERYQTLRALNEVLAPDFQIRVLTESEGSDTHGFILAPAWLWTQLEAHNRKGLERKVKVIGQRDGFH